MPLAPSAGLAVIVHICIIAWHKFFHWVPKDKVIEKRYAVGAMRSLGFIVVLLVSIGIFTLAFTIVHASITERHSSIYFAYGVISNTYAAFFQTKPQPSADKKINAAVMTNVIPAPTPQATSTPIVAPSDDEQQAIMVRSLELAKQVLNMQMELVSSTDTTNP